MNKNRRWSDDDLKNAVRTSTSVRQVLKLLNLKMAGGNYVQISRYIKDYKLNTAHFTGRAWNKGKKLEGIPRTKLSDILKANNYFQSFKLKKRLFKANLKEVKCEECGWNKVSEDGRVPLELHHINGDSQDNRIENLLILCPNCHSLKPSHRGKNIKKRS